MVGFGAMEARRGRYPALNTMKRIVLTVFLAFFSASIVGRSVERTWTWAAQHASDFGHSKAPSGATRLGEARKHMSWQGHTKLLQDGSAEAFFVAGQNPVLPETTVHHASTVFVSDQSNRILSSRAPPTII